MKCETCGGTGRQEPAPQERWADPEGAQERGQLEELGISTAAAIKDRRAGYEALVGRLALVHGLPGLVVHDCCVNTIREMEGLLWLERSSGVVGAREEKRIRLYAEGAGRAVQDTQLIREYGKDAHIVERGMTLQQIATTPDAGKAAVMAAQALDVAQGLIVKGKPETADGGVTFDDAQRDLIRDLAAIARRVSAEIGAIDAEVTPTEDG